LISALINTAFASFLQTGSVSWLYYAQRLEQFPTALLGAALATILLPSLAKYHAVESHGEYSKLLDWGLRLTVLLAFPAALALAFLASPLIATLFLYGEFSSVDLAMVRQALVAYSLGVPAFILIKALAPGFYGRQNVKTPFKVAGFCLFVTMLMNAALIGPLKHVGLALAVSFGAWLNASILFFKLRGQRIYEPVPGWRTFFAKVAVALAAMAILLWYLVGTETEWTEAGALARVAKLCLLIAAGGGVYFGSLLLMGFRPRDFSKRVLA
jgi:putative peptidoglycan lipid II flippase